MLIRMFNVFGAELVQSVKWLKEGCVSEVLLPVV
jgi:hypothetical protein